MKHATREYEIQKKLSHPRIVRLLDVFEVKSIHLLISERRVKNTLVTRSMPRRPHRHTDTHTHTRKHTCIHTHTHTHASKQACIHTRQS